MNINFSGVEYSEGESLKLIYADRSVKHYSGILISVTTNFSLLRTRVDANAKIKCQINYAADQVAFSFAYKSNILSVDEKKPQK